MQKSQLSGDKIHDTREQETPFLLIVRHLEFMSIHPATLIRGLTFKVWTKKTVQIFALHLRTLTNRQFKVKSSTTKRQTLDYLNHTH